MRSPLVLVHYPITANVILWVAGFVVGISAWSFQPQLCVVTLILFPIWMKATKWHQAWVLWTGYFMGTVNGIPVGAQNFFGMHGYDGIMLGIAFWTIHALIIALPYAFIRPTINDPLQKKMMMLCANCIITIAPPLGLLTWGHPIAAAGILFPDLSWAGIILWLLLITCLMQKINNPRLHMKTSVICIVICAISILSNVLHSDSSAPENWHVISTGYSQKASSLNIVEKSNRHQSLQAQIIDLNKEKLNVVIFPENIIGYWNNADSFLWQNWIKHSPYTHLTVLIGAHQKINSLQFDNSIMIISKDDVNAYSARMSMPVGNYNPFAKYSARIFPFNADVKEIAGKKTAFFICYESVLPWFHLLSRSQNPEIIIVASNLWWASNTTLPRAMENYVYAMSRLFNSPILHANNM